jgi:3-oxoacyl-ACP reductase-like protein
MTVDEARPEMDPSAAAPADTPPDAASRAEPAPASAEPVSRATVLAYAVVALLLAIWVLFGWLVQRQGFVESLGEGLGAAFTLLLIVSVIGTVRRSRRG